MKTTRWLLPALLSCSLISACWAQPANTTAREQAVLIDKVVLNAKEPVDIERLAQNLRRPWSLAFAPGGDLLITEKYFGLRLWRNGKLQADLVPGGPTGVLTKADSGILEVTLDPDFASNQLIYLSFVEGDEKANHTAVWRARFDGQRMRDGRVIFRAQPDKAGTNHPGGRMLFLPDKTFLLTIGDGFSYKAAAQDMGSHLGKTLRLTRDGKAAADNPFVGRPGALAEIWTLGHRNAQGLTREAATGDIWLHEHGPRGGDEINRLQAGANYGWPLVTHGIDYDGKIISERAFGPGFERSAFVWVPSIAPSGLAVYGGDAFPDWRGKFLVGGLASKTLSRLRRGRETGLLIEEARLLGGMNKRIRDVREGPDGLVYLLTDEEDGELLRLRPAATPP